MRRSLTKYVFLSCWYIVKVFLLAAWKSYLMRYITPIQMIFMKPIISCQESSTLDVNKYSIHVSCTCLYVSSSSTMCGCFSMWQIVASLLRSSRLRPGLAVNFATSTIFTANSSPVCRWKHLRTRENGPFPKNTIWLIIKFKELSHKVLW